MHVHFANLMCFHCSISVLGHLCISRVASFEYIRHDLLRFLQLSRAVKRSFYKSDVEEE
ncbi:hypothetical protein KIN20_033171 [Parelaphostrongylus tenuis]|uniref:Uncharacterized protein n=1 Tax=Parelaphostrongylus tenuis TaxID=148309 RepID=A0AAD5WI72_PARTN|nr:hypothetical protein KIN20_033171 [Parelaphostrongylus tenuis]